MDCVIKILSHSFWSQLFQKCFFRSSIFGLYGEKKFFLPTSNNWQKLFFTTKTRFSSIRKKLDRWGTIIFLLIFVSFNHHECAKKIASLTIIIYYCEPVLNSSHSWNRMEEWMHHLSERCRSVRLRRMARLMNRLWSARYWSQSWE